MSPGPASALMLSRMSFATDAPLRKSLQRTPSIGSLAKLYGAITFILENPQEIDSYLKEQDER